MELTPALLLQFQKRLAALDELERTSKFESNVEFTDADRAQQIQLRRVLLPLMTDAQQKFYRGLLQLRFFKEKESRLMPLSPTEHDKKEAIEAQLYGLLHFYAVSLVSKQSKSFRKDTDSNPDMLQELQLIFCKHLYEYNPLTAAPTTFFKRHWVGGIARFLTTYSQRMTAHEARTISQVRKTVQELEKQGITPTVTMLSDRTGITPKRVQNAIHRAKTSIWACVDDDSVSSSLRASIATPERSCIDGECTDILSRSIASALTKEEQDFLQVVYDPASEKNGGFLSYKEISRIYNIPVYMAKQRLTIIINKLRACPELKSYYRADTHDDIDTTLHLSANHVNPNVDQGFDEILFDEFDSTDITNNLGDATDMPDCMKSFAVCKQAMKGV